MLSEQACGDPSTVAQHSCQMISDDTIFGPVGSTLASEVQGRVYVLNVQMRKYYGMNPIASWVWTRLKEPVSFGGLRRGIQEAFGLDAATCEKDLAAFLSNLVDAGLIEKKRTAA